MTYDQEERAYVKKLWEDSFRDLEWKLVKREAFKYVFQNETLDGLDDHLRELRTHIALTKVTMMQRNKG